MKSIIFSMKYNIFSMKPIIFGPLWVYFELNLAYVGRRGLNAEALVACLVDESIPRWQQVQGFLTDVR